MYKLNFIINKININSIIVQLNNKKSNNIKSYKK